MTIILEMKEKPSERISDQRIRNPIIEAVHTLAEGDGGVRAVWPTEYFECFYDWIPHHCDGELPSNNALTGEERGPIRHAMLRPKIW